MSANSIWHLMIATINIFFIKVANTSVRNMGTLAGNLMIKHTNNAFASDIFIALVKFNEF